NIFHEAHIMLAVDQMKAGKYDESLHQIAIAREWPERLGSGKPYPEDLDERLEDWLTYQCQVKRKAPEEARQALDRILVFPHSRRSHGVGQVIQPLALKAAGRS